MPVIDGERWRALEPLLDRALELADSDRDAWLADLRDSSPGLAADLVAILSGEGAADEQGFLAVPLVGPGPSLEGVTLGAYTLERPLGHGGDGLSVAGPSKRRPLHRARRCQAAESRAAHTKRTNEVSPRRVHAGASRSPRHRAPA